MAIDPPYMRRPWELPQVPTFASDSAYSGPVERAPLSQYSDAEIAREYHRRVLLALGDQSKTVSVPYAGLPPHLHPSSKI